MPTSQRPRLIRAAWLLAAATVLAGVFALYTRPAFVAGLIDQLWACF
jgi:hypothetical protein